MGEVARRHRVPEGDDLLTDHFEQQFLPVQDALFNLATKFGIVCEISQFFGVFGVAHFEHGLDDVIQTPRSVLEFSSKTECRRRDTKEVIMNVAALRVESCDEIVCCGCQVRRKFVFACDHSVDKTMAAAQKTFLFLDTDAVGTIGRGCLDFFVCLTVETIDHDGNGDR